MRRGLLALGLAAFAATAASADEAPVTVTAKRQDVAFHVDFSGAVDAKEAAEVAWRPQVWGEEVEVEEAHAPGAVEAGAVLVRFRSEKIDDAVRAAERDLAVARAALSVQTEESRGQDLAAATALAQAEKAARDSQQALDTFEKIEKALRTEESAHGLVAMQSWISDQTEELAQLEKMYKADDLTEETEEIVLKRARRDLDRTKRSLDFQTRRDALLREVELPRDEAGLRLGARKTAEDRDHAVSVTKLQRAQAALELERAKANLEKQERDLAKLRADRELFEIRSPVAGFAVPGALLRGKWQNSDDVKRTLRKGGKFAAGAVLFTVVQGRWRVAASVPEASLAWLRAGQDAQIVATQAGFTPWAAKVAPVQRFTSGAEYPIDVEPVAGDSEAFVGTTCRVRVETGRRAAILVPATAVEDGGFDKWVHVVGADGKSARRAVVLGQPHDDGVEVVSGLDEGEKVLVTAPKK